MNARQRRALRYRQQCQRLDRKITEALTGCSYRVAKAIAGGVAGGKTLEEL